MWPRLKQILKPPVFEDEDKTRIAYLLSVTLLTLFIIAILRTVLAASATLEYLVVILRTNAVLVVVLATIFVVMRTGRVRMACIMLTLYQWWIVVWLTYHYGGINLSAYSFFIFVILAAGLLLGGKWAVGYATISVLYGIYLLYFQNQNSVVNISETSTNLFSTITPSFVTTAVLVYLYHRDITGALTRARRNALQFAQANEQLKREIAARKRVEEKLVQAQKMEAIGRLAGGIAHDFNNLLVPIIGYVDLNMDELAPDSAIYADLTQIRQAAERAAGLTRQILAFSRQQVLELSVLDLNEVIEEFSKMLRRLIGEDIELCTTLSPSLYLIKADKGQIEQVLMNLAVNARDAMPAGGRLSIETVNAFLDETYVDKYTSELTPGNYVMLSVSDTGHGIDAETQRRIFDPFFTTKENGKGTGLGLATVFGIIKQHQGNIWVYSEPNHGTTFKIYLPQAQDSPPAAALADTASLPLCGTETVLVVEDEEIVRKLVCETLAAHGYHVIEAKSSAECLQLAAGQDGIDLLLTDVIMPAMNGKELYQKLSAMHRHSKVLYMSGYTNNVIVHRGILDEGVNFLQKPFTIHNLLRKVREVLD